MVLYIIYVFYLWTKISTVLEMLIGKVLEKREEYLFYDDFIHALNTIS